MVIENLQTSTVVEWLLGGRWYEGRLWQTPVIALMLVVLLLAIYFGIRFFRSGDDSIDSGASLKVGIFVWICTFLAAGPLLAIVVRLTTPDGNVKQALDSVLARVSNDFVSFLGPEWLNGALYVWLLIIWGLFTAAFGLSWVFRTISQGPLQATAECGRGLLDLCRDTARMSPRRVLALAYLAWRESLRRRVWMVFVVFVALIMFAGWFLQTNSEHPAQLFIQFVLNWTMYLTMVFALVLSALSLPQDIQDRTLHTIVTKPVRKLEVLLGRLLGFTAMGTVLLFCIGLISYFFATQGGLNHTHILTSEMLQPANLPGQNKQIWRGLTSLKNGHRHEVTIGPGDDEASVETKFDHTHALTIEEKNGKKTYRLGPPEGLFTARVPIYSQSLKFTGQDGKPTGKGVNTGDEWMYRSFIQGATAASAIWTFKINADDFPASKYPAGIPLEMTIEPFRTHKGDLERGVLGTMWVRNPDPNAEFKSKVTVTNFEAKKFATDTQYIRFNLETKSPDGKGTIKVDFFKDIVSKKDGTFEVGLQCLEHAQYFGMAPPDLYIRASDASFELNFFKGYVGIWLQMVMILSIGLLFSTFVSGPVGLLGTLSAMLLGWFGPFLLGIATATIVGGGPLESAIRMGSQDNQISQLPPGIAVSVAVELDKAARLLLRAVTAILPPFADFDLVKYIAFGFDINGTLLTKCLFSELAYVVPVLILAYYCLRAREIAK